ncbi:spermidine synthase [Enhygromyxa salina]|uniref:Spermidine synthase n=2 Tax=Enhygromyxa salina TaxID=215803 RepID=A0A2S9XTH6_9BACT|nr:spermidine synthase [Enhygromyxa salina]
MAAAAFAGAAALACETSWTRLLGLALGHEQLGVLAVLAGFFGGMALGAALAHARADSVRAPARSFALLQVGVAAYAIASPWSLTWFGGWLPGALGLAAPAVLSVVAAAVILLPATLALGASLPLLVAARRQVATDDARGLARLYALDTIGATLGVLAMIHLLLPALGVPRATAVAAALALISAGLASAGWANERPNEQVEQAAPARDPDDGLLRERWISYVAIGVTGLLGLGLEVIGVRVLAQVFSGTIYSFADLLAVWLLGTGLGAGCHARLSARALGRRPATVLVALVWALALSVALTAMLAKAAPELLEWLAPPSSAWGRRQLAELATAGIVLGPTTILMGACFAHLLALIAAPDPNVTPARPRSIGLALAINGLAAAAAPVVFGLWAIGSLTYAEVWAAIAWGYLLLAVGIAWLRRFPPRVIAFGSIVGGLTLLSAGAGAGSLVLVEDEGDAWTIVERREGSLGVVGVSRTTQAPGSIERPLLRLRVDRHFRMGGALSIGERRMGHVSMLLAGPEARAALFLGLGTGATAGAGLSYPLTQLTGVELVPDVIEMLPHFEAVNAGLTTDPRVRLLPVDARRFLRADNGAHDLIVADLFHPARDGAGSLYAREQFTAARERLSPGGLFVQWLPLYQLDWRSLQMIARTFVDVFPHAHAMLALYNVETPALGLIGSASEIQISLAQLERALADPERSALYRELALTDPRDFLAGYMLDRAGLIELAGDAPINDDLHPRVELLAPRAELGPLTGADNLERLLTQRRAWPDGFVTDPDPAALARYRAATAGFADALAHYLQGELALRRRLASAPSTAPVFTRELLAPYLAAYLREPAFLPARPRLFAAAEADPILAEWLLPAMLERTPNHRRAHQAWLAHLARIHDQPRLDVALAAWRELGGD